MPGWGLMFNPFAPLRGEAEARTAAGASSVALVITGAMSAVGASLMATDTQSLKAAAAEEASRFADRSPNTAAILQSIVENGMIEMTIGLVGLWAAVQIILAAWHWRRPGGMIPTVFVVLLVYRIGDRLLKFVTAPAEMTGMAFLAVGLMLLCVLLHVTALRGTSRLAELRRAA